MQLLHLHYLSINAQCLDDVDIFTLDVIRYDGRRDMPAATFRR